MDDTEPSTSGRSRRQKVDKTGRSSALEKLRKLKGSKNKYEVVDLENVYDEVDEKAYSKTVMDRQNDDWIVDDGDGVYVEDGREIFDDDLDNESIQEAAKRSFAGPRKQKKADTKNKGNIKNMFLNMASRKKPEEKINDDGILDDLMSELQMEKPSPKRLEPHVRNKFCVTAKASPMKTVEPKSVTPTATALDDDDILEPMFDKPKQTSLKKNKVIEKSKSDVKRKEDVRTAGKSMVAAQSLSQQIDVDFTQSQESVTESLTIEPVISPVNQVTELESCQLDTDLSDVNFDDIDMDAAVNSLPSASVKVIEKSTCILQSKNSELMDLEVDNNDQAWADDFGEQLTEADISAVNNVEMSSIPFVTTDTGDKVFRFYWWDAYEDQYKSPGTVFLFGKTYCESSKSYISCCLQIKNIPRRIYLLPREFIQKPMEKDEEPEEVTMTDVYEEFNKWATKNRITEFRSTEVSKYYAFDREGTPQQCEYLEVRYAASHPAMDSNYSGPAIEHVFGTTVNALELLLIERNIKGPCWLEVKNPLPAGAPVSWCKLQVNCMKFTNISVYTNPKEKLSIPPMVVATLNVRVALNAKQQQNEVVAIGILLHNKYHIDKAPPKPPFQQHFCLVTHPRDVRWPIHARDHLAKITHTKVIRCDTEYDLLEKFLDIIQNSDPDLLVGNDCEFQFDVLTHRIANTKVKNWSRIGKLKRTTPPYFKAKVNLGSMFCGRPICDIQVSAKELNLKVRSYDLKSLCMAILKKKENECKEIKPTDCPKFYETADKIENLLRITMTEASYIITLLFELNVMPLALQITCIAGNVLSRTLSAGRAERNEYLLLHAFFKKDYITPDKRWASKPKDDKTKSNPRRKKAAYEGGLVLQPQKGFYDKLILLMDFNSLYPSIIQEYNLCFTTVPGAAYADSTDLTLPEGDLEPGVVPTEIRKLVESRGEVKKLMKTPNLPPELKLQYNIRQLALKLTANSMYGCLGASHCRFYAKGLAALVTAKGREILQNTKTLVEKLNYQVLYGDTDSIMINTNILDYDEAFAIAKKIKQEVNKLYKRVELDIDGVFRYLLLLQKKKYAAVLMSKSPSGQIEYITEHKGLDIVRRDWCQLACDTGKNILDQLLSDQSHDERLDKLFSILQEVANNLRSDRVPLSQLVITKQLSKNPKDYPEAKLPHVAVALRLNKEGGRLWKSGDTVPYIVCEDGTSRSSNERVYHIDEFKKSEQLKIDVEYYILNQIFPIIRRLCEPIEGIDDVLLAEYLGVQEVYKAKRVAHDTEVIQIPLDMNEDIFKYCLPLKFKCRNNECNAEIEVKEFFTTFPTGQLPFLARCTNDKCNMPPWKYVKAIQNELQHALRKIITDYYAGWMECEDPLCSHKTRKMPLNVLGIFPKCIRCRDSKMYRIYTEEQLYTQISFYLHLFDINQAPSKSMQGINNPEMISAYDLVKEFIEKQLRRNAYSVVNLDKIFALERSDDLEKPILLEFGDDDIVISDDDSSEEILNLDAI